jgi:hypothetical protein
MSEKLHEGGDPYNNDPFKKGTVEKRTASDTVEFDLTPEEAKEAERALYETLNYDGPDKDKLNSVMASLRKEEDKDQGYKKAA